MVYMDYIDLEIAKTLKASENANTDIHKPVTIQGEVLEFVETTLFGDTISVLLPKSFVDMPKPIAKIKYPSESRPQVIKTDLTGITNFTYSLFDVQADERQLLEAAEATQKILKKVNPALMLLDDPQWIETEHTKSVWFTYKNSALDMLIYYAAHYTRIGNKLLYGIFNCDLGTYTDWEPLVPQVIESIKYIKKEK